MGLLNNLKFWWKPWWTFRDSYTVVDHPIEPEGEMYYAFLITRGKFRGNKFVLSHIELTGVPDSEEGNLAFDVEHINGYTHRDVVHAVVLDFLKWSIDNYNETHKAVLSDDSEDNRTNYIEEPVNERRVCSTCPTVSKE